MNRPEQALQRAVVQLLELLYPPGRSRVIWLHPPNGGWRRKVEAAILKAMGAQPGASDLLFLWGTGSACIELKADRGRLSPAQERFMAWCDVAGVAWAVCRSVDQVERVLREWVAERGMPAGRGQGRRGRHDRPNNPPPPRVLSPRGRDAAR